MTRRKEIIEAAYLGAAKFINTLPEESIIRENNNLINEICLQYLTRAKGPISPTVVNISEEMNGKLTPRAIYNWYAHIPRVWRRAYKELMNIEAGENGTWLQRLRNLDRSSMDEGTRNSFDMLLRTLDEQDVIIARLRKKVTDLVPIHLGDDHVDLLTELGYWAIDLANLGFEVDEAAVRVSEDTPIGTAVMRRELYDLIRLQVGNGKK